MAGKVSLAALIALLLSFGVAHAQRVPRDSNPDPDELRDIFTIQVENDYFNLFGRTDRDYTNGLRFAWLSPALGELPEGWATLLTFPTFFGEKSATSVTRRLGISLGQNIYTPVDTAAAYPIYNDRPYAAWLYSSFALQSTYKHTNDKGKEEPIRLDTLQLDLGVVGPAAGGAFVQNNFHRYIGDPAANGWPFQLHNEPALDLAFERRWRIAPAKLFEDPKLEYDIIPSIGAVVGSVATYASAGGIIRIGKELRADFGPPRARPAMPGSEGFVGEGFGWYIFFGATGEAVARNMFLDGNIDGNSFVHVTHRPLVAEATAGLAILYRGMRLSFTQVLRTPEFYERDRWDQFASINLTFRY